MAEDPYVKYRCPCCGAPWKGTPLNGGVDHPPESVAICARYAPNSVPDESDDLVVMANLPGEHRRKTMKAYPDEVMPPAYRRPEPTLRDLLAEFSMNGR